MNLFSSFSGSQVVNFHGTPLFFLFCFLKKSLIIHPHVYVYVKVIFYLYQAAVHLYLQVEIYWIIFLQEKLIALEDDINPVHHKGSVMLVSLGSVKGFYPDVHDIIVLEYRKITRKRHLHYRVLLIVKIAPLYDECRGIRKDIATELYLWILWFPEYLILDGTALQCYFLSKGPLFCAPQGGE